MGIVQSIKSQKAWGFWVLFGYFGISGTRRSSIRGYEAVIRKSSRSHFQRLVIPAILDSGPSKLHRLLPSPSGVEICAQTQIIITDWGSIIYIQTIISMFSFRLGSWLNNRGCHRMHLCIRLPHPLISHFGRTSSHFLGALIADDFQVFVELGLLLHQGAPP